MRRSRQLPDLIRLVRLKWPSGVLIERERCWTAVEIELSTSLLTRSDGLRRHSFKSFTYQCALVSLPNQLSVHLLDLPEGHTEKLFVHNKYFFLAHRLSTTGPILVSWFWTFLCSVPFALHAVILSSSRLWVNATLVAYFTAHAKCFCDTQLKI